ncbi:hypothetical protein LTR95_015350, partial [Oleoguttula sp. CCFEE 5521]
MTKRDIEAVPLGSFTVGSRGDKEDPTIAPWRSNLTALSQEHNLYFVAFAECVWVYGPIHDVETICHEPVQIVHTLPSADKLQGYLSRHRPHAINNILVAKLGNEEVLACVRDDGDCEVFMLRHILSAIENWRRDFSKSADMLKLIFDRPIYRINVGISAWGLAIHSQARILAVSSNRHEITVVKFALVNGTDGTGSLPKAQAPKPETGERRTETSVQVFHGTSNIPHIAFCNTTDDPHGRWLATTDISGVCTFIDLQADSGFMQSVRFGPSFAEGGRHTYDRINAGWGIMFLDRRSFTSETSKRRALGLDHGEELPDKTDPTIWDLSGTTRNLE